MVVWQSGSLAVSLARDEVFGHESAVDVVEETARVGGVRVAVRPCEAHTVELREERSMENPELNCIILIS